MLCFKVVKYPQNLLIFPKHNSISVEYIKAVVIGLNHVNCVKYLKNLFMLGNTGLNLVHKHFGQL